MPVPNKSKKFRLIFRNHLKNLGKLSLFLQDHIIGLKNLVKATKLYFTYQNNDLFLRYIKSGSLLYVLTQCGPLLNVSYNIPLVSKSELLQMSLYLSWKKPKHKLELLCSMPWWWHQILPGRQCPRASVVRLLHLLYWQDLTFYILLYKLL